MGKGEERESRNRGTFDKKLLTYSVAAGAALAVAAPANAAIIYSGPKNLTVNAANPWVTVDLDGDTLDDFGFSFWYYSYPSFLTEQGVSMFGLQTGHRFIGSWQSGTAWYGPWSWFFPYRMAQGQMISAGAPGSWYSWYGDLNELSCYYHSPYTYGNFVNQKGFIGVEIDIGGDTHYGWIEYEGTVVGNCLVEESGAGNDGNKNRMNIEGRITGWAYEDVAEKAIAAGDRGRPQAVPTLNQWGIIFLVGLILLEGARRLRNKREEE